MSDVPPDLIDGIQMLEKDGLVEFDKRTGRWHLTEKGDKVQRGETTGLDLPPNLAAHSAEYERLVNRLRNLAGEPPFDDGWQMSDFEAALQAAAGNANPPEWDPLNVVPASVIVANDERTDARTVGAILNHDNTHVIGVVPRTPAGELGLRRAADLLKLPIDWDAVERLDHNRDAQRWLTLVDEPAVVDGRWRLIAYAFAHTMARLATEESEHFAKAWFDNNLDEIQRRSNELGLRSPIRARLRRREDLS